MHDHIRVPYPRSTAATCSCHSLVIRCPITWQISAVFRCCVNATLGEDVHNCYCTNYHRKTAYIFLSIEQVLSVMRALTDRINSCQTVETFDKEIYKQNKYFHMRPQRQFVCMRIWKCFRQLFALVTDDGHETT